MTMGRGKPHQLPALDRRRGKNPEAVEWPLAPPGVQGSGHRPPGPLGDPFGIAQTELSGGLPPRVRLGYQHQPPQPLAPSAFWRV